MDEDWNAQKMLDLYIHDYLVRKNLLTSADILAREAGIPPKAVAINSPDGFLSEWWSLFWDVYNSRRNNPQGQGEQDSSSSQAPVNDGSLLQNVDQASPVPDINFMLQSLCPKTLGAGLPNLMQAANPASMPMPEMGSFLHTVFPALLPPMEFNLIHFGQTPTPISGSMSQDQLMAVLLTERAREQEHHRVPPPRNINASPSPFNVDQLARMLPMTDSSSRRQKKTNSRRQHPVSNDSIFGTSARRAIPPELTLAPRHVQEDMGQAGGGSSASSNSACPDTSS